ncbi:NAD kinase [Thermaurantimonas aggregans]|uniref:NAD kinase n=1 Tax=Thermaurantimonas aggregans TaxID=2173829 RepID=A0A401XIG0_9FLAO|nr:NAD kinase [Thermaurantimonas aggregans]MCX8148739.1 NAD kinase [Thermaurantimonas aggregans]GCD76796.1 NAD kinase [Thermaurantimonas aggregans]
MKVAIFGISIPTDGSTYVQHLLNVLSAANVAYSLYLPLVTVLKEQNISFTAIDVFENEEDLYLKNPDFLICLGGDGTILEASTLTAGTGIPVMGINLGRLGFLSNVSRNDIDLAISMLCQGRFTVSERSMLSLRNSSSPLGADFLALNEVTVSRKDSASMITIHAWIDDQFLASYWADGLIISTPTGSTGYNLSCGGPIVSPASGVMIITPIAPHNLNVRPVVISDSSQIRLQIEAREKYFLVATDSKTQNIECGKDLLIQKAKVTFSLVQLEGYPYYKILREKLYWGADKRN